MKVKVSRDFTRWYAGRTGELFYDREVLDFPFEVIREHRQGTAHHYYALLDCNTVELPCVPAEFVAIIE